MAHLHNRISQKELKERMMAETEPRRTVSFYRYFPINDPQAFRDELFARLEMLNVFGRIYVAHEGINAQVSVPTSLFDAFIKLLYSIKHLDGLRLNTAVDDDGKSFWVLKIKVREKIVADGIDDPAFDMENRGRYVNAAEFNRLSEDPDTIVVDMRNHYEYEVGHFDGAIEVPSDTFRQQLPMAAEMLTEAKDKNIIMYCTGGIRCEKASAYMRHRGFKNVFHLEGGILNYVHQAKQDGLPLKFRGKNFVFDNRLGERVTEEVIATCHQCGGAADTHVNCANEACHLLFIQCERCKTKWEGCCSKDCFDFIHLPVDEQKEKRKGVDKGRNIFNKSRKRLRPKAGE
ncbi:MAG TPA: rhodanese-related sulfurtransferase [Flavisolibacter sp.]|nr:rhodanese-related sulfurtransferase [Flavisolibacter sp.]